MKHAREDYNRIQDPAGLIPDDEPVFLLRAQDICSVATMDRWIEFAKLVGVEAPMIEAAYRQMERMKAWQLDRVVKTPDMPA